MKLPAKYQAARRALAEARRVDEVKSIRDKAVAMEVYAQQAKDAKLIAYASEIRKRAERRLGELMQDKRKAGKLAKGARGNPRGRGAKIVRVADGPAQSLADQGIDKHLADRARKAAALTERQFEAQVAKTVKRAVAAVEGDKSIIREARVEVNAEKKARRDARERKLGEKISCLPDKKYGVIVADPEWRFEPWSRETGLDRAADNHYPTSLLEVIKSRPVANIAADDCVLFLWATVPMLPHALEAMAAWGFDYRSHVAWFKERPGDGRGTGYWFINEHELCLLGVKGKIPCPAPGDQWPSIMSAPTGRHSQKPDRFLELVEAYFPNLPKIELNRRGLPRPGWDAWGNEVLQEAAE